MIFRESLNLFSFSSEVPLKDKKKISKLNDKEKVAVKTIIHEFITNTFIFL